jgi:redox-sensing transcriptional repressor
MKRIHIPKPSLTRLCKLYDLLQQLEKSGMDSVSSKEMGSLLGLAPHNIRKDIRFIEKSGITGSGYIVSSLKRQIENTLGYTSVKNACVIGLDFFGSAILNLKNAIESNIKIIAGFDSDINRIETMKIDIPVYPTYEIPIVVKNNSIEIAIITDPGSNPDAVVKRLQGSGIKGILNFSPVNMQSASKGIFISNIDIIGEFRYLLACIFLSNSE